MSHGKGKKFEAAWYFLLSFQRHLVTRNGQSFLLMIALSTRIQSTVEKVPKWRCLPFGHFSSIVV